MKSPLIANLVNKEFWIPVNVSQSCINDLLYWYTWNVSLILILILYQKCIMILDTWYFFSIKISRYVSWYMYHWYSPTLVAPCWMLHTILASECITYDVSYVLVLVTSSPCPQPWPWESSTWPQDFQSLTHHCCDDGRFLCNCNSCLLMKLIIISLCLLLYTIQLCSERYNVVVHIIY